MIGDIANSIRFSKTMISIIPWWMWIVIIVIGMCIVVVDTILMKGENTTTEETNQIYRWNFDTRLGMYSPE